MFGELILAHLIGDYLLQNDFMATGKKKSSLICLFHAFLYTIPFFFIAHNLDRYCTFRVTNHYNVMFFCVAVGVQHFIQDRWSLSDYWMKFIGQEKFMNPPCGPWSIFVIDNVFHLTWIWLMAKIFMS